MSPACVRMDVDVDTLEFRGRVGTYVRAAVLFSSSSSFNIRPRRLEGNEETPSPFFPVLPRKNRSTHANQAGC